MLAGNGFLKCEKIGNFNCKLFGKITKCDFFGEKNEKISQIVI
jgi:hypothetical protein